MYLLIVILAVLSVTTARLTSLERDGIARELLETRQADQWCEDPIKKAKVEFPEHIIGRAETNFDMHSGYVNVTKNDFLFYWHFTSADGKGDTAPLIIWTNGGPGCSSMEGATTENGPLSLFDIKESCTLNSQNKQCDYTLQLSTNKYSWNQHANMVYVDQPRFVGNSGGNADAQMIHSTIDASNDFITFYHGFIELFPEYKNRKVIIAGESYGGHYIPAFSQAILNENAKNDNDKKIPYVGAIIGNGCVDDDIQSNDEYVKFLHESNLIPSSSKPRGRADADLAINKHIGYTPNYYDYRIQSITCNGCFGYNYNNWSHWFIDDDVKKSMNVCGNAGDDAFAGSAGGCINVQPFDVNDKFDYMGALANTLDAGIPITMYYGKADTACNYVGGYTMTNAIKWKSQLNFQNLDLKPLEIAGVEAGQMKELNGLTWLQIESAGHMVGLDQGAASSIALQTILQKL